MNNGPTIAMAAFLAIVPIGRALAIEEENVIGEVIVTAQRRQQPRMEYAGNIDRIDAETINETAYQHIHELLGQVAGVWVVRGSGQEHLTAIRSPVLSGAGSCGGYLLLEDGIPTRPAGFCNVNQMLEVAGELADSVEVIRGPGNALYGSNAVHGVINVLMPSYDETGYSDVSLELGANSFKRVKTTLNGNAGSPWLASAVYADDGGFREDSGYEQGKVHLKRDGRMFDGDVTLAFSATYLDQDTAGFIFGEDAYKDPELVESNPNVGAFRKADSQRLYALWLRQYEKFDLDVRPYLRHSDMEFMHHFRPGKPVEGNGQISGGVMTTANFSDGKSPVVTGVDIEWADTYLQQTQDGVTEGSGRQVETLPQGKHYDYEVTSTSISPYIQLEFQTTEKLTLGAGLRMEYIQYDYDNLMLDGNTRDDGTECGFGGCLYTRPSDRSDSFTNLVPKLSARYQVNEGTSVFSTLMRGFRAPQMTELYRLQNGQEVSDLDSERIDSFEVGLRLQRSEWAADFVAYTMNKRDSVFVDAEGFNVTGARSKHRGVEIALEWQFHQLWRATFDATFAKHQYDFTQQGRGEQFVSGRDMDSAPRELGSVEIQYQPVEKLKLSLQLIKLGDYFLEAQNRFKYPGHELANLRLFYQFSNRLGLSLRVNNLADKAVADRADYGFGNYRYFPGRSREVFAEVRYTLAN